jgi:hypothetical protein
MARCPNHDDSQICPDCTHRGRYAKTARALSPLDQHKADLEMIIAACNTVAADAHVVPVRNAYERIAKLATTLRSRVPIDNQPVQSPRLRGGEIVAEGADRVVTKRVMNYQPNALCFDIACGWGHRGEYTHTLASNHAMETGHPVTVENLTSVVYEVL